METIGVSGVDVMESRWNFRYAERGGWKIPAYRDRLARDADIYRRFLGGEKQAAIGRRYGLSRGTVGHIVAAQKKGAG